MKTQKWMLIAIGFVVPLALLALLLWGLGQGPAVDAAPRPDLAVDETAVRASHAPDVAPARLPPVSAAGPIVHRAAAYASFYQPDYMRNTWLPYVANGYKGWYTSITIQSISFTTTTREIEIYDVAGRSFFTGTLTLPPHGSRTIPLRAIDALPEGFAGSLRIGMGGASGQEWGAIARLDKEDAPSGNA